MHLQEFAKEEEPRIAAVVALQGAQEVYSPLLLRSSTSSCFSSNEKRHEKCRGCIGI